VVRDQAEEEVHHVTDYEKPDQPQRHYVASCPPPVNETQPDDQNRKEAEQHPERLDRNGEVRKEDRQKGRGTSYKQGRSHVPAESQSDISLPRRKWLSGLVFAHHETERNDRVIGSFGRDPTRDGRLGAMAFRPEPYWPQGQI
jgi:hypothetical protein